jgi:hypothetical protein
MTLICGVTSLGETIFLRLISQSPRSKLRFAVFCVDVATASVAMRCPTLELAHRRRKSMSEVLAMFDNFFVHPNGFCKADRTFNVHKRIVSIYLSISLNLF